MIDTKSHDTRKQLVACYSIDIALKLSMDGLVGNYWHSFWVVCDLLYCFYYFTHMGPQVHSFLTVICYRFSLWFTHVQADLVLTAGSVSCLLWVLC